MKYFKGPVVLRYAYKIYLGFLFQIAEQEMPGIMALRHKAKEDKPLKGARFVVLKDYFRIIDFQMHEAS
jgi:hypothetical protein